MAVKPSGELVVLREQTIEDGVLGMTLQLEKRASGEYALRIFGDVLGGNRTFVFDAEGVFAGAGTQLTGRCSPGWLQPVD